MSKKSETEVEEQAPLEICNLTSQGMSLAEARKFLAKKSEQKESTSGETEVKLSTKEKKQLIADEIEALGYEPPTENESLAKFKEVLDYAKEQSEEGGDTETEGML